MRSTNCASSPGVEPGKTGAIGFCAGGKCVLDLARAGADILGGVSFHGVYDAPPFPNAAITAKLLVCEDGTTRSARLLPRTGCAKS